MDFIIPFTDPSYGSMEHWAEIWKSIMESFSNLEHKTLEEFFYQQEQDNEAREKLLVVYSYFFIFDYIFLCAI